MTKLIPPSGTTHIAALDLLRALAVLMVGTAHFGRAFSPATGQFCADYGKLGVEVFFVISGYIILHSLARSGYSIGPGNYGPFRVFALKRFFRIYPPYLAAVALTLVIMWPWRHALGLPWLESWDTVVGSLVFLHAPIDNPVFWSLLIELEFYLLIALLFPLLAHRRMLVAGGTLVALLALARFSGEPGGAFHLPQYLPRFAAGIALFWLSEGKIGWERFFAMLAALWFWERNVDSATTTLLTSLAVAGLLQWHRGELPRVFAPLLFIGTISYSFFLIHLPIGGKLITSLRFIVGNDEAWGVPLFLGAFALSIGVSYLFYLGVEAPFHRLGGRLAKRKKA